MRKKYMIGSKHTNRYGDEFEIIANPPNSSKDIITIKFLPDGPIKSVYRSNIGRGVVVRETDESRKGQETKYVVGSVHQNKLGVEYEIIKRNGNDITIRFLPNGPERSCVLTTLYSGNISNNVRDQAAKKKAEKGDKTTPPIQKKESNPYFYYVFKYEFDIIAEIMARRGEAFVVKALNESIGVSKLSLDDLETLAFKDEFKMFYKHLIEMNTIENIIETMRERKK